MIDRASIRALTDGKGAGGNITVDASESVEINGRGVFAQLTTQTFFEGDAGTIAVRTGKLVLRDGGQITSSTLGRGNGGTVTVNASQSVEASGRGEFKGEVFRSGLLAQSAGSLFRVLGKEGNISVNTGRLVVRDGATLSVSSIERNQDVPS
ncbi:MAG: hypothetical protein HC820_03715, partial [Hydrococcus sp. RM1_1_31]|nr:hypothetical protein [Hydrococcus sp. RM1_1_31]